MLLSQDEARFPLVPTLVRTLGCKGHRPVVGSWDNKDLVYAFASVNCITGKLVRRVVKSPTAARRRTPHSKTRRMQQDFARHLLDVGRVYPKQFFPQVVLTIDGAPWHRGPRIQKALARVPHVQLYRLPSYSPQLNVIERLWKRLRHHATHNRLFADSAELQRTLGRHFTWLQAHRAEVRSLISAPP